uniref:immunoglobulin superfamily member 6 isoform X3 n=1 Tax=Doryrhamphus excisus TaxID=161450 RepID=UPI0025AE1B0A|nr:immunoglobulin superfamily member 6 isoform X3 [Doryrhamphus excisus]
MVPLFCLTLFLTCLPLQGVAQLQSCLWQPSNVIVRETGQDGEIWCRVHTNCSDKGLHYQWFTFRRRNHIRLNLDATSHKYSLQGATLQIMSLNTNDSGIYYCAAVSHGEPRPGGQHVGMGTTLVVREKTKLMVGHVLLWLTFVLLVIYSLTTVTLIVQKKCGFNIWTCRRLYKSDKKSSRNKTTIFRDVLHEMRHRRDLKRSKRASTRNPAPVEVWLYCSMLSQDILSKHLK